MTGVSVLVTRGSVLVIGVWVLMSGVGVPMSGVRVFMTGFGFRGWWNLNHSTHQIIKAHRS